MLIAPLATAAQTRSVVFGDEAFKDGLYKTACEYYKEAINAGAKDLDIRYKFAESSRLAFRYRDAANSYLIVSQSTKAYRWPDCDYHLAHMLKACGKPDSALLFFNRYLKNNIGDPHLIENAKHETEVCQWILEHNTPPATVPFANAYSSARISKAQALINSRTQVAPCLVDSNSLFFSSFLEISSPNSLNPVTDNFVLQSVYTTTIKGSDDSALTSVVPWSLNSKKQHTCNTAYDPQGRNIYFNYCPAESFSDVPCAIYVSHYDGKLWGKPRRLDKNVNPNDGSTNTQPAVGYLDDGRTILFFASNREGGMGGMDIWYSIIENDGRCSPAVNLGAPVNTVGNEITPFYDRQRSRLFFSSDYHYCYGGYDIFVSEGIRDSWTRPVNVGLPVNSTYNDVFFIASDDGDWGYLASNRNHISIDTGTASSSNCCNDIYHWSLAVQERAAQPTEPKREEAVDTARIISHKDPLLPLPLFFDNDEPDPKSTATSTSKTYYETFNYYMFRRNEYKQRQSGSARGSSANADSLVDGFFYREVAVGRKGLDKLMRRMEDDLKRGLTVSITLEGYASKIHTQAYNYNLSKRRISSIVNQFLQYNNGSLAKYLSPDSAGGTLRIIERPYGSDLAAAPTGDPVYGLDAARQRCIRIVDYRNSLTGSDSSVLQLPSNTFSIGSVKAGSSATVMVNLEHKATAATRLRHISIGQPWGDIKSPPKTFLRNYTPLIPGEALSIYIYVDASKSQPISQILIPLTLQVDGEDSSHTLFLQLEIISDK